MSPTEINIVNISSIAGLRSFPSLGYYCASKYAVEGLSESLWQEVEPLGIKVTLVEPSGFRTDWAGRSANASAYQISGYEQTSGKALRTIQDSSGSQPGDPVRAASAIIQAVEAADSPRRLLLGNDAFDGAMAKISEMRTEFELYETVTRWADSPVAALESLASRD
jgi:short-subunit dehydrogenase